MMVERFIEQYPAIQATSLDQRARKPMERDRLARLTEEDFRKAEIFIRLMKKLYTSTLCVSSEKSPTCGQILPILKQLEKHFSVKEGDTVFALNVKQAVWGNLSKRYQSAKASDVNTFVDIRSFLEEATALDPRFKHNVEDSSSVWERVKRKMMKGKETESEQPTDDGEDGVPQSEPEEEEEERETDEEGAQSEEEEFQPPPCKRLAMSPLEELFAEEDNHKIKVQSIKITSLKQQLETELKMYRAMPPKLVSDDPAKWWWDNRSTYPSLSEVAIPYLCVQASSTPSERVFSTAGDTICAERARILPGKADMLIFLNRNC